MRTIKNMLRCLRYGDNAVVVLRHDQGIQASVSCALVGEHGDVLAIDRTEAGIRNRKRESMYSNWFTEIRDVYVAPIRRDWL